MRHRVLSLWAVVMVAAAASGPSASAAPPQRYLIYLHGRIVQEQQSPRPKSPEFGYYELEKILETFRGKGFVVSGSIRPKKATPSQSADRVVQEVRELLRTGVPADRVTVVGASLGGEIAMLASARLHDPDVRFVVLGACASEAAEPLVGRILAIREESDDFTRTCVASKDSAVREIRLHTGLKHGFLYRPLPEWVNPAVDWALGSHE